MSDPLDRMLHRLAAAPPDRSLAGVEADVWLRMGQTSVWSPVASLRVRAASIGMALLAGAAIGGVSAAAAASQGPVEMAVFSAEPTLAPSTLLDGLS